MTLVKVQLPIDIDRARKTGKAYAEKGNQNLLVYDRWNEHVFEGRDDELRNYMLAADGGTGFMKAFLQAEWDGARWVIDYTAGFQPLASW